MRRFIRLSSGPLLLLSIVSTFALGTYVLRKIFSRTPIAEAGSEAAGGADSHPSDTVTDINAGDSAPDDEVIADPEPAGSVPEPQPLSGTVFYQPRLRLYRAADGRGGGTEQLLFLSEADRRPRVARHCLFTRRNRFRQPGHRVLRGSRFHSLIGCPRRRLSPHVRHRRHLVRAA